ncbi:MAG: SdiA-regulated domain-containing protein [Rudanella sp.]|nr:SdiA-regulated domain-containing protein [Rudanella sp.]
MFLPVSLRPIFRCFALFTLASVLFVACQPNKKKEQTDESSLPNAPIPYDLANPTERFSLPKDLREVSGLSYYKPGRLAMVQDELAVVFIYDLATKTVVDEHVFGRKGDYEGVEFVNGELYMLRSDGELFHFEPTDGIKILNGGAEIHRTKIELPGKNDVEGLGYDPKLNALLLATKDPATGNPDKPIYFYDLKRSVLWRGPVLTQAVLADMAGNKPTEEVKPSGLAVHPKTGDYYVLSANAHRLVVMNRNGKTLSSVALDPKLLRQPEGICFAPDGTLFIASEGDGKKGYLLQFAEK